MNEIARELNKKIENSVVLNLLSEMGKRFYFPKGIVAQSAEASKNAKRFNATIGIAKIGSKPIHLSLIRQMVPELDENEIFPYAPTPGILELRELWKAQMIKKNPGLKDKTTTTPLVVGGLTNGISLVADMFFDPGDKIIMPDIYWDNYPLIFEDKKEVEIVTFPYFAGSGFDLDGFKKVMAAHAGEKKICLLLNFPNNPTGYTPSKQEAAGIAAVLKEYAERGCRILTIFDDSYFSLFYEEKTYKQSLFVDCADLHPNILAVKLDGPTKEDFVWGFRLGFITFACKGLNAAQYDVLTQKTMGLIRATISNSNVLGQNLLLRAIKNKLYEKDKAAAFELIAAKYYKVKEVLSKISSDKIEIMPFNSGYFMCLKLKNMKAETLRRYLLTELAIGTISIQENFLRIAYSSVDVDKMEELFTEIFAAAEKLS